MSQAAREHRRLRSAAAMLVLLITVAYGGSLWNELVFDELIFMERDARVHSLHEVHRLFLEPLWSGTSQSGNAGVHQYYRPLQLLPLTLSYALFGTAAWPSHLLNLVLHAFNCLLILSIFRCLLLNETAAVAAVLLFAVHPGYSESVLWVSDVAGLGAAFCILAIFRLHLSARWYAALLTAPLFLCGMWFKESGVLAVALLALYDLVGAADRGWRRLWRMRWRYAVCGPPLAAYVALRVHALGGLLPGLNTDALTGPEMLLNAVGLLPQYVGTFVWPFDLNMYHDFDILHGLTNWRFAAGALVVLTSATVAAGCVRSHRLVTFGLLWAAATTAPHLLIRWPQLNVFAERYVYLPAIGVFLATVAACTALPRGRSHGHWLLAGGSLTVVLAIFVFTDARRTRDWRDELTIYGKTLTQSTRAELVRLNLAVRLYALGRYDEGITLLHDLMAMRPDWPQVHFNLGLLYMAKGNTDEAMHAFEEAFRRDPLNPQTLLNLGFLSDRQGRRDLAVEYYLRLVQLDPQSTAGWYNLGVVALETGQLGNAQTAVDRVLALTPDDVQARAAQRRLATLARSGGSPRRDPAVTLRRCTAARTAADAERTDDAIIMLQAAAWLDETAPLPHQYLANLYVLAGRVTEAISEQRAALQRAPDNDLYRRNLEALERAATGRERRGGS